MNRIFTSALIFVIVLSFATNSAHGRPPLDSCQDNPTSILDETVWKSIQPYAEIPEAILAVASKLDALTPKCADKIWPSSGVGSFQVVLVDPITKQPWLWTPKGFTGPKDPGGIERIDPKELEKYPDVFQSRYTFKQFRGKKTVSLLLNQKGFRTFEEEQQEVEKQKKAGRLPPEFELTKDLYLENKKSSFEGDFTTLVHESFHAYGQGTHHPDDGHDHRWKVVKDQEQEFSEGIMNRYSEYPLETGPRYFRRMQFESMLKAINSKDQAEKDKYLAEASYWQKQYEESGDEHTRTNGSDISEGTAKYFDFMASIYAKHGCNLTAEEEKKIIENEIAKLVGQLEKRGGLPPVADLESYNIGLLSGLLLAQSSEPSDWKKKLMTDRKTPAEILLENRDPLKAKEDPTIRAAIEVAQEKENQQLGGLMRGLSSHEKEKGAWVRLQLPQHLGAYSHRGYYQYKEVSDSIIAVSTSKKYVSKDFNIEIENVSMLMEKQSPCSTQKGASNNFIFVPKSSLKQNGTRVEFDFADPQTAFKDPRGGPLMPKAKGQGTYEAKQSADGREWYCLK